MKGHVMKTLSVSEDIIPLGEFKARAARVLKDLRERGNTLVITQNGRPACVVMAPAEYDRIREREGFLEAVAQGMADIEAGRVTSDDELGERLDTELGRLEGE
jgi:prevent-host-death family protein